MFDEDKKKKNEKQPPNLNIFPHSLLVCIDCEKGAERQTPNARIVQVFHLCSQRVCFCLSNFPC